MRQSTSYLLCYSRRRPNGLPAYLPTYLPTYLTNASPYEYGVEENDLIPGSQVPPGLCSLPVVYYIYALIYCPLYTLRRGL